MNRGLIVIHNTIISRAKRRWRFRARYIELIAMASIRLQYDPRGRELDFSLQFHSSFSVVYLDAEVKFLYLE